MNEPAIGSDALLDLVDHTFATSTSLVLTVVLNLLLPLVVFALATLRWLSWRRKLRLAETQTMDALLGSPRVGDIAAFQGRVELLAGNDVAFRISVEQSGRQTESKGRVRHDWSEVRRELTFAPFQLRDGARIVARVVPSEVSELVGEPSRTELRSPTERIRFIELQQGEEIYAVGAVQPARAQNEPPTLVDPPRGRLLLSNRPLQERYRGWTRFHLVFVVASLAIVAFANLFHVPFFLRLGSGEAGEGTVVALESKSWSGSKGLRVACVIVVERPDGYVMNAELNRAIEKGSFEKSPCEKLVAVGDRVPIVFVRGSQGLDQFGREPGARHDVVLGFGVLALLALALLLLLPRIFPSRTSDGPLQEGGNGPLVV